MKTITLDKYKKYKSDDVNWLGEFPAHWEVKRIKDLSTLQSGNNIVSEQIEETGLYPVYGGGGLRGYFSDYTNDGDHILIGRQGALCGNINYASGKFWASEHSVVVYEKRFTITKWYGEILKVMNLNQYSVSAAQPGLAVDRIKRLLLPLPPLVEQQAIADYLDDKTAQIDHKIELLEGKAEKYVNLKQSLINETVTRGLDKTVPMKDSGVEWIGQIPTHWEMKRLKDIANIQNSNVDKKSHEHELPVRLCNYVDVYKNEYIESSLEFMKATADESEIRRFGIKKNDVLITKDSETFDDIAVPALAVETLEDVICGYHLAQIRTNPKILSGAYLFRLFQSQRYGFRFMVNAKGITRVGLGQSAIADAMTPIPPLTEQEAIVEFLESKTAQIEKIIETIHLEVEKLYELRKTLINDVVTGKIKVYEETIHE